MFSINFLVQRCWISSDHFRKRLLRFRDCKCTNYFRPCNFFLFFYSIIDGICLTILIFTSEKSHTISLNPIMRKLSVLLFCLALALGAAAQEPVALDYFLPDTCNYDKNIPTPSSVLGFEVGEYQITPEQGVAYIKALAAASDRVLLRQYGWTHERRPLYLLIISTEDNIRNIDRIKSKHDLPTGRQAGRSSTGSATASMGTRRADSMHLCCWPIIWLRHVRHIQIKCWKTISS